jgi:hypothetical protein
MDRQRSRIILITLLLTLKKKNREKKKEKRDHCLNARRAGEEKVLYVKGQIRRETNSFEFFLLNKYSNQFVFIKTNFINFKINNNISI